MAVGDVTAVLGSLGRPVPAPTEIAPVASSTMRSSVLTLVCKRSRSAASNRTASEIRLTSASISKDDCLCVILRDDGSGDDPVTCDSRWEPASVEAAANAIATAANAALPHKASCHAFPLKRHPS